MTVTANSNYNNSGRAVMTNVEVSSKLMITAVKELWVDSGSPIVKSNTKSTDRETTAGENRRWNEETNKIRLIRPSCRLTDEMTPIEVFTVEVVGMLISRQKSSKKQTTGSYKTSKGPGTPLLIDNIVLLTVIEALSPWYRLEKEWRWFLQPRSSRRERQPKKSRKLSLIL